MEFDKQERIAAIVRGVIGAIAIILGMYGITVDQEAWATVIMEIACMGVAVYTWWWKNNNVTAHAAHAQEYLDYIKENDFADNGEVPDEVIYPKEV